MKTEEAIHLAQVSLKNGNSTEVEREEAMRAAVAKGITNRNFLWSRVLLEMTNGNVQIAQEWLKEKDTSFGDYYENAEAWSTIRYQLANGAMIEGLERACQLREFITLRGDDKSYALLLPEIDAVIAEESLQNKLTDFSTSVVVRRCKMQSP